jgi:chloramphenicol 3-O phosphotransferase
MIVLNGGSSAGKSTLARRLQDTLPTPWLRFSVDDLVDAIPQKGITDGSLLHIRGDGQVATGRGWRALETSWYLGLRSMAVNGTGVIVDEVLLQGGRKQARLRSLLAGVEVLWVGVLCAAQVAAARETLRPDRVPGMAASQAEVVHEGMDYGLTVDSGALTLDACVATIVSHLSPPD